MKQWIKKHRVKIWISSILILCISIGGYLWIRNKQITEAKQEIQYSNHLLSEFHRQKTPYQKIDFLLHKLPDSNKKSPFCFYHYDRGYPDNGWRDANPDMVEVSSTTNHDNIKNYEVLYLYQNTYQEDPKNIWSFRIKNTKTDEEYDFDINNNWQIIQFTQSGKQPISKQKQKEIFEIGKQEIKFLFKKIEQEIKQYKEHAEKTLKYYHASYKKK